MFWPILAASAAAVGLIKLGSLYVWVQILGLNVYAAKASTEANWFPIPETGLSYITLHCAGTHWSHKSVYLHKHALGCFYYLRSSGAHVL